ncbi:NlpC/P60 family protein [Thomasclavelia cocleata]|uniref:NlpC/P60 family protein n=1 Tax=Thomasclavelia cocleata TaxID=69824 RepID=UPI00255A9242|nr:NlpC/P60 family protein [Thomasclavelia cocleata]
MRDIKTRDKVNQTVKTLDRAAIVADKFRNATVKSKEVAEHTQTADETSPEEYAVNLVSDKSRTVLNRTAVKFNEKGKQSVVETKRNIQHFRSVQTAKTMRRHRTDNKPSASPDLNVSDKGGKYDIKTRESIKKANTKPVIKDIKGADKTIKTVNHSVNQTVKSSSDTARKSYISSKQSAKTAKKSAEAAKKSFEKSAKTMKEVAKHTKKIVKGIIEGAKAVVNAIIAGGWLSVVIIIILCLVGALASSFYGIFFSTETSESGMNISTVIQEINSDYDNRIDELKASGSYDSVEINGSKSNWKDVLSIYAVKTTTDPNNPMEIATFDDTKKSILSNIFWNMNSIDSKTETRTETKETTSTDENGEEVVTTEEVTIKVLIITINGKTANETAADYSFNKKQKEYLAELMDESNDKLWASIIFGFSGSNSDIDIGSLDFGNETVSDIQRKLVAVATNSEKYGISARSGYCEAWVADVYQAATGSRGSAHCALCAADMWAVSDDWSKIQVGATVYGYASNPFGHVGIYIGNGKVIHNLSGTVKVQSLESWVKDFKGFAWGWENNTTLQ